jgi:hypothetical protein
MEFLALIFMVFVAVKGIKFYLAFSREQAERDAAAAAARAEQLRAEAAAEAERVARLMTTPEGRFQLQSEAAQRQHAETLKAQERQHAEALKAQERQFAEKAAADARRHEQELAALKLCGTCGDGKDSRAHLNNCRAA